MADTWDSGDPYERYVGRWSRLVAPLFLAWLDIPYGRQWLDVGCGTGALSAAILANAAPDRVTGVDPSEGFLARAARHLGTGVTLAVGDATRIPLGTASVDVTVSGLVLNFTPDPVAALVEQARVTVPGGTVAAYVWDYAGGMRFLRLFWDTVVELDPAAAELDEGARFPLCRPDRLVDVCRVAGLDNVTVTAIDIETRFADFADLWEPFLGGQGPGPSYVASLDAASRAALRHALHQRVPAGEGEIVLPARAWAVRGVRGLAERPGTPPAS